MRAAEDWHGGEAGAGTNIDSRALQRWEAAELGNLLFVVESIGYPSLCNKLSHSGFNVTHIHAFTLSVREEPSNSFAGSKLESLMRPWWGRPLSSPQDFWLNSAGFRPSIPWGLLARGSLYQSQWKSSFRMEEGTVMTEVTPAIFAIFGQKQITDPPHTPGGVIMRM